MKKLIIPLLVAFVSLACAMTAIPAKTAAQTTSSLSPALKNELEQASNPMPTTKTLSATVTAFQSLYVRSEPNPYSRIVGHLKHGDVVIIYSCWGKWARINQDDGQPEYVNSFYLSKPC